MARIRVKVKQTGELGTIPEERFNASVFEKVAGGSAKTKKTTTKKQPSIGEFAGNAGRDVGELLGGILGLPKLAFDVATREDLSLGDVGQAMGKGIVDEYGTLIKDPLGTAYKRPVSTILDVLPFLQVGKLATAGKLGSTAGKAGTVGKVLSKAGKVGSTVKKIDTILPDEVATTVKNSGIISKTGNLLRENARGLKVPKSMSPTRFEQVNATLNKYLKGSPKAQWQQTDKVIGGLSDDITRTLQTTKSKPLTVAQAKSLIKNKAVKEVTYELSNPAQVREYNMAIKELSKYAKNGQLTAEGLFKFKQTLGKQLSRAFSKDTLTNKEAARMAIWRSLDDTIKTSNPAVKKLTVTQSHLIEGQDLLNPAMQKGIGIGPIKISRRPLAAMQDITGRGAMTVGKFGGDLTTGAVGQLKNPKVIGGEAYVANILNKGGMQDMIPAQTTPDVQGDVLNQPMDNLSSENITQKIMKPENITQYDGWFTDNNTGNDYTDDMSKIFDNNSGQWVNIEDYQTQQPTNNQNETIRQQFQQAMLMDLMQTGGKNITELKALYDMSKVPEEKKLSTAEQTAINSAYGGLKLVDTLADKYTEVQQQGLTAQSPGLGILGGLKGTGASITQTSPEAKAYEDSKDSFMSLIARAAGEKGVLTDYDLIRIKKALPNFYDTPETASQKLAMLKSVLANALSIRGIEVPQEYQ